MNFVFELQKDKRVREDNLLQLKIVSLWDVLRIHAHDFVFVCTLMSRITGIFDEVKRTQPDRKSVVRPPIKDHVRNLRDHTAKMGLKVTTDWANELFKYLSEHNSVEFAVLDRLMEPLPEKLVNELKEQLLLRVCPEHKLLYLGRKQFLSGKVIKALPELKTVAKKARKCFALEEYTASAFHLMRVMELLVQRFAAKLNITLNPDIDTWGTVLVQVRQKIDSWDKPHLNYPQKQQYMACYNSMDGLRPARNDLMHYRQNYDEEGAQDLKGAVELIIKAFLKLPQLTVNP